MRTCPPDAVPGLLVPAVADGPSSPWDGLFARLLDGAEASEVLALLVAGLRGDGASGAPARMSALQAELAARPTVAARLGRALRTELAGRSALAALTESGVPSTRSFSGELLARLGQRLLPSPADAGDLRALLRGLLVPSGDVDWVEAIEPAAWVRLLDRLGLGAPTGLHPEVAQAVRILAHHVASLGLQPEVADRRAPGEGESPFLLLSDRVLGYVRSFEGGVGDPRLLGDALGTAARCRDEIARLRSEYGQRGATLHLTSVTTRLLRLLDRLEQLLGLTVRDDAVFRARAVGLFLELVRAEATRNHLLPPIRERSDLVAVQVVEHAARKGSAYITRGRRDYARFFVSSLGGGALVAVFALLKIALASGSLPPGLEAIAYGVNYTVCFVLIYLTGATLATKQPAMTANTLARALGEPGRRSLARLEDLVVRAWRSQFVSFAGNLGMALPLSIALCALVALLAGSPVADPSKSAQLLDELHPWRSGSLFFAAVAGVLLFAAGLVTGWVDNRSVSARLRERVAAMPLLTRTVGTHHAGRIAAFLDRRAGMLAGNAFLGFGLGSLGALGEIFGLPLDIRHVAFAAAHLGAALEGLPAASAAAAAWPAALGVALIGLVNFLVSFGLSLAVALEARGITTREARALAVGLARRFASSPLEFFLPPRERTAPRRLSGERLGGRAG